MGLSHVEPDPCGVTANALGWLSYFGRLTDFKITRPINQNVSLDYAVRQVRTIGVDLTDGWDKVV